MNQVDFLRKNLIKTVIKIGVNKNDAYRIVDPIVERYKKNSYKKLSDLFDIAKKDAKNILKSNKQGK